LRALGQELPAGRLRRVVERLAVALEGGASLPDALRSEGRRVPPQLSGLVVAGARTGRLGEVLGRFAGYANLGVDLRRSLSLRLVVPGISIGFAVALLIFICVVVISKFDNIFKDFGMPVPFLTRMLFSVARGVTNVWWPFTQVFAVLVVLWLAAGLVPWAPVNRGAFSMLPLIGRVWRLSSLAEFSHLLALLLECEVPLVEALPMAGQGVGDGEVASASTQAAREVAAGQRLADTTAIKRLFPSGFARILAWAELHRGLPEALHMAGEMFEARARAQATLATTFCNVMVVLTILGGISMIVLSILIPMINLIARLAG
jgi:general secretion pathway protein F